MGCRGSAALLARRLLGPWRLQSRGQPSIYGSPGVEGGFGDKWPFLPFVDQAAHAGEGMNVLNLVFHAGL